MTKFFILLLASVGALAQTTPVVRLKSGTTPGNGNCMNWGVSGSIFTAGDAGAPCGSGSGGGGGVVTYSGPTLSILSGTAFCPVGGGGACSATETNVDIDSSATATVSNMYVQLSQALGAGNSVTVTWRDNAASKSVTCTISGGSATSCNDTTHSFTVTTADLIDYQLVFSGTIIVTPTITVMSAFGTSNVGVTSVSGNSPISSSGGTTPAISCATCLTGTPTNHGVPIGSATQANNYTGAGTSGQVLTSNGPSSDPTFQAAAAGGPVYCADATGSTTTYTCPSATLAAYTPGVILTFVPQAANTGASTVNVASLGPKSIVWPSGAAALITSDLLAAGQYTLTYDGTNFVLNNGPDGPWIGFSYQNSWSDLAGGNELGQYRKDRMGIVTLHGILNAGTTTGGTVVTALPAGYRPPSTNHPIFGADGTPNIKRLNVATGGNITLVDSPASFFEMYTSFPTH